MLLDVEGEEASQERGGAVSCRSIPPDSRLLSLEVEQRPSDVVQLASIRNGTLANVSSLVV